jgi:hypothetical protein
MTRIPLVISFWFMITTYVIHILDESLLGGSFVEKIRQHWWPEYSWRKFFWFNAGYLFIMCTPNPNDVSFELLRRSEQPTAVVHETICEQVHW